MSGIRIVAPELPPRPVLPKGKLNVQWRQGRCGYVVTVSGQDLLGVACAMTYLYAIQEAQANYQDPDVRLTELDRKIQAGELTIK